MNNQEANIRTACIIKKVKKHPKIQLIEKDYRGITIIWKDKKISDTKYTGLYGLSWLESNLKKKNIKTDSIRCSR